MNEVYIRNILNTYKLFNKRQREILESLARTKEVYTFDNLQEILQKDTEAKEILKKIRFIVNGEYEKAGVSKAVSNNSISKPTNNDGTQEVELMI